MGDHINYNIPPLAAPSTSLPSFHNISNLIHPPSPPSPPPPGQSSLLQSQQLKNVPPPSLAAPPPQGNRRLNIEDALNYLDQVKGYYQNDSDVYDSFLDIMKDFNTHKIDTPGVIDRVSTLFGNNPTLIQGFNTFLPPDYSLFYSIDINDPTPIKITTPSGLISRSVNSNYSTFTPSSEYHMHADADNKSQEPIEMDDAISYVNKIKIRFAKEPEIYNSFIEILQTFQKEQKAIEDVYSQISILFKDAPDLLNDFQKFLPDPEREQQFLNQQELMLDHQQQQILLEGQQMPVAINSTQELPPVGNFNNQQQHVIVPPTVAPVNEITSIFNQLGNGGEYVEEFEFFARVYKHINDDEIYNNFLKLINLFTNESIDKYTLIDRVYTFIGSDLLLFQWFKEFVNFDTGALSDEATNTVIINNTFDERQKLDLNRLESNGASYKKLPDAETFAPCSGRDEMCWAVLNDQWVGHPTWASENSGFVAHKKNQFEEVLFKIEEERHEYDFYLEANTRTIQTLETIGKQILSMSPEEKKLFTLKDALRSTSQTIYKKVIRKVYGDENGLRVIEAIQNSPLVAIPVVLRRLKLKDEEWKKAHREWNKVWRDQENKVFFKSLDHLGLNFKQVDKKFLNMKNLVTEINSLKLEELNSKLNRPNKLPDFREDTGTDSLLVNPQLNFTIDDNKILIDITRLLYELLNSFSTYTLSSKKDHINFFITFLKLFFNINKSEEIEALENYTVFREEIESFLKLKKESEMEADTVTSNVQKVDSDKKLKKGNKKSNSKKAIDSKKHDEYLEALKALKKERMHEKYTINIIADMLEDRQANKRARTSSASSNVDTFTLTAPGTTPSFADSMQDDFSKILSNSNNWNSIGFNESTPVDLNTNVLTKDHLRLNVANLFCNANIFFLIRLITVLYQRLVELKKMCRDLVVNNKVMKLKENTPYAKVFELNPQANSFILPSVVAADIYGASAAFPSADKNTLIKGIYEETLQLIGKLFHNKVDKSTYEETLRQSFWNRAYKLFSIQKVVQDLVHSIKKPLTSNSLKRNTELALFKLFEDDRRFSLESTTLRKQITYMKKSREIIGKDDYLFRISNIQKLLGSSNISISFIDCDDQILKDIASLSEEKWLKAMSTYLSLVPSTFAGSFYPFIELSSSAEADIDSIIEEKSNRLFTVVKVDAGYRLFFNSYT